MVTIDMPIEIRIKIPSLATEVASKQQVLSSIQK